MWKSKEENARWHRNARKYRERFDEQLAKAHELIWNKSGKIRADHQQSSTKQL